VEPWLRSLIDERLRTLELPRGQDGAAGRDGIDGKSIDLESLRQQVQQAVELVLEPVQAHMTDMHSHAMTAMCSYIEEQTAALEKAVAALPMPKDGRDGKDGIPGERGERGESGLAGKDGVSGVDGAHGEKGIDGRDGRDGKDGRDGAHGKDGVAGRDALEINTLPAIDKTRSYAEGTYAFEAGGMLRAMRETDPLDDARSLFDAGWRIVLNGVASVYSELVGPRKVILHQRMTDGTTSEAAFDFAVPLFKGVWRDGAYSAADMVQRDGSVWMALRDTTTTPRSGAEDWVLVTKKGADGKDGKNGDPGPRGPEGKAGKDLTQMTFDGKKY
jgi:integrin beta 3